MYRQEQLRRVETPQDEGGEGGKLGIATTGMI